MKILLLNTQMEAAGAQKALLTLAQGLQARGHQVWVVTMYDKADYVPLFSQQYGVTIIDLQMKPRSGFLKKGYAVAAGLHRLYRLLQQEQIQVMQSFSLYSNLLGPLIAWLAGVPVRISSQRMSLRGYHPLWLKLDKWVANSRLVQTMTVVAEGTRTYCINEQGIKPEKLVTIYNGIDVDRYNITLTAEERTTLLTELDLPSTAVVITHIARLHPQKGHPYLLQAIPTILTAMPHAHFLLIGDGELHSQIQTQLAQTTLTPHVHLLGTRQDIPHLLALSQLLILPSLWEGLPNTVLEAMAARLPVVASDVDGCAELILDQQTGILIPPAQAQPLASAIIYLLQNPNLATQMGQAGQERVQTHFSIPQNITHYETLYRRHLPHSTN